MQGWTVFHLASKIAYGDCYEWVFTRLLKCDAKLNYTDAEVGRTCAYGSILLDHAVAQYLVQCKCDVCECFSVV